MNRHLLLLITCASAAEWALFDADWKFHRGDSPGGNVSALDASGAVACGTAFCKKSFDDADWTPTETPHDWSIEDLPTRVSDPQFPVLAVRTGNWLFSKLDYQHYANVSFNDSGWTTVSVPHDWRDPPANHTGAGVFGWYRRHIAPASAAQVAAAQVGSLQLALGTVADKAAVYLNGIPVGTTGDLNSTDGACTDYLNYHSFEVPAGVLSSTAENIVAVRVRSGPDASLPGGLYDSMAPDAREGPFDPAASPGLKQTGYTVAGVGWYRKQFSAPVAAAGRRTTLRFDGVYMHAEVYLNEALVAAHPYGYTTFDIDITDQLVQGTNVLAVRVQSNGSNSRWYAGAGIYRHVRIATAPAVHALTLGGVRVVAPQASIDLLAKTATVTVTTTMLNKGTTLVTATVSATIQPPGSGPPLLLSGVDVIIRAGGQVNVTQSVLVAQVKLWSPHSPSLYGAAVTITSSAGQETVHTRFGVRHLSFDSSTGFRLNGVVTKLQGGCVHHDNGPLGSRAIDRAEERRVQVLKAAGYNAIRTSHNPVSPAFVAACDEHGVMLMEEAFDCWDQGKNDQDYHLYFDNWWQRDVASMVLRDVNSPSIVMWSIGNEIPNRATERGVSLARQLADFVRWLDPLEGNGRAVTSAYPGPQLDTITDRYMAALDVSGYNYGWKTYEDAHSRVPSRVIAGTESFPAESFDTWQAVLNNSWVIGDFIWTAIDYIGESAIGGTGFNTPDLRACAGYCPQGWSWHISFCGDIDIVGHRKPQSLYRTVMWNVSQLELAVHDPIPAGQKEVIASWGWPSEHASWSWDVPAGTWMSVNVYSQYSSVAMLLNGKWLGAAKSTYQHAVYFEVPYFAGNLTAVGYNQQGVEMERKTISSAAAAARIHLSADRGTINADRSDLSYVTASIVDEQGTLVHQAAVELTFSVDGHGELAAVGSGDPADASSFYKSVRTTYLGKAVAIVRPGSVGTRPAPGVITLTVSGDGLKSASVSITVGSAIIEF